MSDWAAETERLLFDGEDVEERMDVGPDHLVVTSHRVLAFMPSGDGPNFSAAHRPNVEDVTMQAGGNPAHLQRAIKAGVLGVFLLVGGATVSLDGMLDASIDTSAASQTGVGQVVGMFSVLAMLMNLVDDALLVGGVLSLAVAATALTLYLRSRNTTVVVEVTGGDDIYMTGDDVTEGSVTRLRRALGLSGQHAITFTDEDA